MKVIEKIEELSKNSSLYFKKEGIIEKSVNFAELDWGVCWRGSGKGYYRWRQRGWKNTGWRESAEAIKGKDKKNLKKKSCNIQQKLEQTISYSNLWELVLIKNPIKRWITLRPWTVLISEVWFKRKRGANLERNDELPRAHETAEETAYGTYRHCHR